MRLIYDPSSRIYVAHTDARDEDERARLAGFSYTKVSRQWITSSAIVASRLIDCADDALRTRLEPILQAGELSSAKDAQIDVPAPAGVVFMPFQKAGIAAMLQRKKTLLADEMGLGKTWEALGLINCLPDIKRVLVICPASIKLNWAREARKVLSRRFNIAVLMPQDAGLMHFQDGDFLIVNYDILDRFDVLAIAEIDLLIVDECHCCKNAATKRSKLVAGIHATREVFLTGTPIPNRVGELWPIADRLAGWSEHDPYAHGRFTHKFCQWDHFKWDDYPVDSPYRRSQEEKRNRAMAELQDILRKTCFVGDTLISTEYGQIPIRDLVQGKLPYRAWTMGKMGRLSLQSITGWSATPRDGLLVRVTHENGCFICTRDHPIYTSRGWHAAGELAIGDTVRALRQPIRTLGTDLPLGSNLLQATRRDFRFSRIRHVEILALGDRREAPGVGEIDHFVYDIEVTENHNFIANGVVAHNCMIRRRKADVLPELPPKFRQVIELDPGSAKAIVRNEVQFYDNWQAELDKLRFEVAAAKTRNEDEYKDAIKSLNDTVSAGMAEMSKLRHMTALAKVPHVIKRLKELIEEDNQRIVCFAHHRDVIAQIADAFDGCAVRITGDTSQSDRQLAVDQFQTLDKVKLFVGSLYAAGEGITLTAAKTAVYCELDWSPKTLSQSEDRLHRIGQKDSVLIQHLVFNESLDARMAKMVISKQELADRALNQRSTL